VTVIVNEMNVVPAENAPAAQPVPTPPAPAQNCSEQEIELAVQLRAARCRRLEAY
jgi:hypothetical protein